MVEPDLSVVCDKSKIDEHGCKGAPDLIIEILSPSTSRHDRLVKYNLYQRAGAFVRLGVDESTRIAQMLNYSVSTVYAYRNRMRNKALDRENFDRDVMRIGRSKVEES